MAVLLGVLVALSFGTGDFFGGRASGQASVLGTLVISQTCAFVGAVVLVSVTAGTVATHDLALGALAGLVNVLGLGLLYGALARFVIGVVAPITAVVASLVPVSWGLLQGERPSVLSLCGVGLAIVAGALIARDPSERTGRWAAGAAVAAVSGVALGASLVLFAETDSDSGMWPVFAARTAATIAVLAVALVLVLRRRTARLPQGRTIALAVAAGLLDVGATAMLVLAVRRGLIVLVAPIASLAPGFTVLLAWVVLGEQLGRVQRLGLLCALAGLVLVSTG